MPPRLVIVIREDPQKSHRAVEALRIALGLSTGENLPMVVLLGQAPLLLSRDPEEMVDGEILEKHLPFVKQLGIPFVVVTGSRSRFTLDPEFMVSELSEDTIRSLVADADRALIF